VKEAERVRCAVTVWITIRLERKCIAGFCGLFGVSFDNGLLIKIFSLPFMLIDYPGLGISPWYRLVLGFSVIFSESNFLCSFVFQFDHFICFILFVFFCIFILSLVVKCNV